MPLFLEVKIAGYGGVYANPIGLKESFGKENKGEYVGDARRAGLDVSLVLHHGHPGTWFAQESEMSVHHLEMTIYTLTRYFRG
jgi:hypothetical protein